jgi:hypothetical protein
MDCENGSDAATLRPERREVWSAALCDAEGRIADDRIG